MHSHEQLNTGVVTPVCTILRAATWVMVLNCQCPCDHGKIHCASIPFLYNTKNYGLPCSCQTYDLPYTGSQSIYQGIYSWCHHRVSVGVSGHLAKKCFWAPVWLYSPALFPDRFSPHGKIGLVKSLFRSCSLCQNVGSPIRLLCESDVMHGIMVTKKAEQSWQYAGD